ncbi:hypothetical protein WA026_000093 [Henosepilachna vigintioctopunctata]|uniref:Uncharacterized protein n=1 Tax=Henosepilachna vigintioctopunctata TaxID=420089 RepID=A0AAW1V4Q2_9CUCU
MSFGTKLDGPMLSTNEPTTRGPLIQTRRLQTKNKQQHIQIPKRYHQFTNTEETGDKNITKPGGKKTTTHKHRPWKKNRPGITPTFELFDRLEYLRVDKDRPIIFRRFLMGSSLPM